MKKLILLLFLLPLISSAQVFRQYFEVPGITTQFGVILPYAQLVKVTDSSKLYQLTHKGTALTNTMAFMLTSGWAIAITGSGSGSITIINTVNNYFDSISNIYNYPDTTHGTSSDPLCTGIIIKIGNDYWQHTPEYATSQKTVADTSHLVSVDSIYVSGKWYHIISIASQTPTTTTYNVIDLSVKTGCKWIKQGTPDAFSWSKNGDSLYPTHFPDSVQVNTLKAKSDVTVKGTLYPNLFMKFLGGGGNIYAEKPGDASTFSGIGFTPDIGLGSFITHGRVNGDTIYSYQQFNSTSLYERYGLGFTEVGISNLSKILNAWYYVFDKAGFYPLSYRTINGHYAATLGLSTNLWYNAYFETLPTITNPGYAVVQASDGSLAKSVVSAGSSDSWQYEVVSDAQNNFTVPFTLSATSVVESGGIPLTSSLWSGIGTSTLTVSVGTLKFDHITIIK